MSDILDLDIGIDAKELWTVGYVGDCIQRAKAVGTVTDDGRRELAEGLQTLLSFQEKLSPLVMLLMEEDFPAFSHLMPADVHEDVLSGKKQAIGALRHNAFQEVEAVGVLVYETDTMPLLEETVYRIDWLYVPEGWREMQVANVLMAWMFLLAFTEPKISMTTTILPISFADDPEMGALVKRFFEDWGFSFQEETDTLLFTEDRKYVYASEVEQYVTDDEEWNSVFDTSLKQWSIPVEEGIL